ncbi:kinase-like domain-containing protein [Cantharellus anzutake]|uniref:kinase-like domain-containing protein n=1 Tax=Cantharellus anzutake TaxID=1750568 RepID=UPI001908873F|nr:kinase-like domain-containing protein [Cantharellus anzutake]KAF8311227.1 kinase-like domain-containing protein [Cantharellus anzutake]
MAFHRQMEMRSSMGRHIRIWGRLVHRNIEAFRGWALSVEGRKLHVGFISSWRESVAVRRYLRQNPSADRRELVHGVAQGLLYLHSEGVVHANIHPDNVMIGNEGDSYLRGFDFSYDHRSEEPLYGYRGGLQLRFTPPELLNRPTPIPTESSDIWAFGCISGEILTGRPPYAGLSDTEVMTNPVASPVAPYHLNDVDPFEGAIPGCFLPRDQRPRIKDIIGTWSQHLSPPIHAPAPPNNDDPTKSYVAGSSRESRRSSKGSGCLTCRLRKKRCPRFTDSTDPCSECERLRLQCLRHGFTWPNEEKLAEARQKIREWTAPKRPRSHGLVGYFPSLHSLISAIVGMLNLSEIFLDASLGSMSQGGVMGSGVGPSGGQGDTGPAHPLPDELFMGFASEQIPHLENVQLPPVIPGVDESDNAGEALCWPAFSL